MGALRAEVYHDWCARHFDSVETAAGLASPLRDADQDGCTNVVEYFAGTDPRDGGSCLVIERGPVPGTVVFAMAMDREDVEYEVVVGDDLVDWWPQAIYLSPGPEVSWDLGGSPFVKVGVKRRPGYLLDSDRDGLDDLFEESLVAADAADAITHIGEVWPGDDFDGDGTANEDEEGSAGEGWVAEVPGVVEAPVLNVALDGRPADSAGGMEVFSPLQ